MKFIANVTYGYTSASFSGRMPAVEIADAIVQSGRETLEKVKFPSQCIASGRLNIFPGGRQSKLLIPRSDGEQGLFMGIQILYSSI